MDVKQINRYLVKGLKIMSNERDSVRVALEAIPPALCMELLPSAGYGYLLQFSCSRLSN